MTAPEVMSRVSCDEHCEEVHSFVPDDALRHAITALAEAYHRGHDEQFAWRLCSNNVCRETAFALGVRA